MQRKNRPLVGALVLSAAALLAAGGSMAGASAQEDEADRARQEYVKMSCYACHGYQGLAAAAARALLPIPSPMRPSRGWCGGLLMSCRLTHPIFSATNN